MVIALVAHDGGAITTTSRSVGTIVLLILVATASPARGDDSLRPALEKAWQRFLDASHSANLSDVEKTTSAFLFGTVINQAASLKLTVGPELAKLFTAYVPDIATARFVRVIEKGPTAALVYVRDSDQRDSSNRPRVDFFVLKFVKDAAGWKVDGSGQIPELKYQDGGKETGFEPSDIPRELAIDGVVRPAPSRIGAPDVKGVIDIACPGYRTEVTINGIRQAPQSSGSRSSVIAGGLRRGKNDIVIVFTKIEPDPGFNPSVTVRRFIGTSDGKQVFTFEAEARIEGIHTFSFVVND